MWLVTLLLPGVRNKIGATPVIVVLCDKIKAFSGCLNGLWFVFLFFYVGSRCVYLWMYNMQTPLKKKHFTDTQHDGPLLKSKVHHWDWAKMLLYRWPRLMSSVCAPLMLAASREQTASHRVRGNEDDNDTWNMVGCRYVNHRHLFAVLFIAASVCMKDSNISAASQQYVFNFFLTFAVSHTLTRARVNMSLLSPDRLYLW